MEMTDERFWESLKKHPVLRERFESILDIAENTDGDCIKADDAEERLKKNDYESVLEDLSQKIEPPDLADKQALIRVCHCYLSFRQDQLDYKGALAAGLPIGEIESGHRFVIQKRLKLPGAW